MGFYVLFVWFGCCAGQGSFLLDVGGDGTLSDLDSSVAVEFSDD